MSRSSVIYGTFSIVWGFGAGILTVVLQRLAGKEDRYIFLAGSVLGGVYEYLCSVFTEIFLGTTFWDYSDMPFNIGGRTNLLYCIFWGLLSVVWVKICYPTISGWIEKLPPLADPEPLHYQITDGVLDRWVYSPAGYEKPAVETVFTAEDP